MRATIIALSLLITAVPALAEEFSEANPVVVELFTSQGCSSCPPADAVLRELSEQPQILALSLHVTYWNSLGWADPYSLDAATARQRQYQRAFDTETIYTPQIVVQGQAEMVGSDRPAVARAIMHAASDLARHPGPKTSLSRDGDTLSVRIGEGVGRASVLLIGFDRQHRTAIARGENAGRNLQEANVVRSLRKLGDWDGTKLTMTTLVPQGERISILLQAADGKILGATTLQDHSTSNRNEG